MNKKDDYESLMKEGEAEEKRGMYEAAREKYEQASRIRPDLPEPFFYIGNTYLSQQNFKKAECWYEKAVKRKPDSAHMAYYNLSVAQIRMGKVREAVENLRKAIEAAKNTKGGWQMVVSFYKPHLKKYELYLAIYEKIEDFVERVKKELDPERIILFGSLARGDPDIVREGTDVDIIVVKESDEPFAKRQELIYRYSLSDVPMQIFWYTPEEVKKSVERSIFYREEVFAEGKQRILYDRRKESEKEE